MNSYDTNSRKVWQLAMNDLKPQIEGICIITEDKMIRMISSTMGLFIGIKIRAVTNEESVCFERK